MELKKLPKALIIPSAAYTLSRKHVKGYTHLDKAPQVGDVVVGEIAQQGQHHSLEHGSGRIHSVFTGTRALFVFGNRYAPDYYEGLIPQQLPEHVDLLARSGLVGQVISKSSKVIDPTQVRVMGYAIGENEQVLNTRDYPAIVPKQAEKKFPRAKLILVVGTAMNSGKSATAVACVRALSTQGHEVRASKVTGTASLKDILNMNDAGASRYADFSFLGYPSTYLLTEAEALEVFNTLDLRYANNRENFWVVEFADGILQRETAMLLQHPDVRKRIHKLIFCAADAFGAIGGLQVLRDKLHLVPDAISGVCSSSPLHISELREFTDTPVFNGLNPDLKELTELLRSRKSTKLLVD